MSVILIILIFGVIVAFHEFGHFLLAKLNHVGVLEYAIGMGPAIFSFTKNETKYSLRLLPLGGYCMLKGEEEESDDDDAFGNKSVWARMLVIAAGPVFNFILAFVFSIVLIHYTGCDPSTLSYVQEDGAAAEAGIEVGDTIKTLKSSDDTFEQHIYNYRELLLYMELHNDGKPITMKMEKADGTEYTVTVTPKLNSSGEYKIGVAGGYVASTGIGNDIKYAGLELRYWLKATVCSLKMIFTGQVKSNQVMGPVGVGDAFNDVIEEVKEDSTTQSETIANIALNVLNWCILLSVNLGVMNLLPIPALDGGRLLFLIIEAIRRKKIPADKESLVNLIGFVILIGIMVLVFFNDINNVFIKK